MAYTTIDKPQDYFNTLLYSGDGSSSSARTGVGFQPDWMWFKRRDGSGTHAVFDIVRGTNGTVYRRLLPQSTNAEDTASGTVLAIGSDGFTLGNDSNINQSGETYVSWNWLGSNTTASNSDGSITSTVSANTTAGFSIVGYTGTGSNATVGHGLNSAPEMVIIKQRTESIQSWCTFHAAIGAGKFIDLNRSDAVNNNGSTRYTSVPSSTVLNLGSSDAVNKSGKDYVGYVFNSVKGYSKMTQYTGNGSSDGPFVYTGFKPAWVIHKGMNNSNGWHVHDNKRDPINPCNTPLFPQASIGEGSDTLCDFLSNGLKIRSTLGSRNGNGSTYLIMAFAENPFVSSSGVPGTAR